MKKILYITGLLFLCSLFGISVRAQSIPRFGVIGGANFATISNSHQDRRTGFLGGFYGNFFFGGSSSFSFSPEVLYSEKGYDSVVFDQDQRVEEKLMLDYIDIPLLFKYHFIPNGSIHPNIYIGPYIGFIAHSKYEFSNNDEKTTESAYAKTMDFGFSLGGGVEIGMVNVGFRYVSGFIDVNEAEEIPPYKNRVISIVAGIGF